jgi:hypothetical protein
VSFGVCFTGFGSIQITESPVSLFSFLNFPMFFLFFFGCVFLLLYVGLIFTFFWLFSDGDSCVPWCFSALALDLEVWFGFRSSVIVLGVFLFLGFEVLEGS